MEPREKKDKIFELSYKKRKKKTAILSILGKVNFNDILLSALA